jgi:hypothetical protein
MLTQNIQLQPALLVAFGNQPKANADRFGLGLVMAESPAVLSQVVGHSFPPQLPTPEPTEREGCGYPPSSAPAGPVGRVHRFPVCLMALADAKTTAATADVESKLDPFGRRRDCQSLPGRTKSQTDSMTNASWPRRTVTTQTPGTK